MELSINDYINFISLHNSPWGWLLLSVFFILIAQFCSFMTISLMCIYPQILWAASWKPIVTLYPIYPLIMFLCLKYLRQIVIAIFENRYGIAILFSSLIVIWAFLSPFLYPASYGLPITFTQNPNYQRGIQLLAVLLFLPAVLNSREDIRSFLHSTTLLLVLVHLLVIIAAVFFLVSGHSLYDLHLMRILDTPPVFWESGLLLLCLAYYFVLRKMNSGFLIFFIVIGCVGLILGNSRTRFLATFFCLLYFIYPFVSKRILAWTVSIVLLLSVSPLLLPHNVTDYFSRLINQRIEQSSGNDFSEIARGRMNACKFAYERWKKHPLLGVGSCYILPRESMLDKRNAKSMPRVHNYYFEVLAGQGATGFVLLIIVLGLTFIMIWRIAREKANKVLDGRLIIALFWFGIINWLFKESWGITYSTIAMLSAYTRIRKSASPV